jgi:hypothetical protein
MKDGHSVRCVYPRATFATVFEVQSDLYKWADSNTKYGLGVEDQKLLCREVDSAINNIENLDLA